MTEDSAPRRALPVSDRRTGPDILCEDLVRIYSTEGIEVQALQGLSLRVDPGEVVAIVGASGSGKSTLLNILSGLDKPTGGRARVAGQDLGSMSPAQRVSYRRHTVGFVWQQTSRNLLPFLTARENVMVPMMISNRRDRTRRAMELLDLLGVGEFAERRPAELSGGQQQRVAIAIALANSPDVLLADEPTGELDQESSIAVMEAMREAALAVDATLLVVTHNPEIGEHVMRTIQILDGRTSTEVLRRRVVGPDGIGRVEATEFTVIDRFGRLQLPRAHVRDLGLEERVRIERAHDHVGIWPDESRRDHE